MSAILLLSLWLASRKPGHSPAIARWFRAYLYGTVVLELVLHLAGWDTDLYTYVYIAYTLVMMAVSLGVVLEAYRENP